jgi:hypothetical protein
VRQRRFFIGAPLAQWHTVSAARMRSCWPVSRKLLDDHGHTQRNARPVRPMTMMTPRTTRSERWMEAGGLRLAFSGRRRSAP